MTSNQNQIDLCQEQPLRLVKERSTKKTKLDELLDDLTDVDQLSKRFKTELDEGCSKSEINLNLNEDNYSTDLGSLTKYKDSSKNTNESSNESNDRQSIDDNQNDLLQKLIEQRLISNLIRVNKRTIDELDDDEEDNESSDNNELNEDSLVRDNLVNDESDDEDEDNYQNNLIYESLLNNNLITSNLLPLLKKRLLTEDANCPTDLNNLNGDNFLENNLLNLISLNSNRSLNNLSNPSSSNLSDDLPNSLSNDLDNNSLINLNNINNSSNHKAKSSLNGKPQTKTTAKKPNKSNKNSTFRKQNNKQDETINLIDHSLVDGDNRKNKNLNFNGKQQIDLNLIQNLLLKVISLSFFLN